MNRARCPLAQICQRARTKPSQPPNAMMAGTTGRFSPRPGDGVRCRRELSSSDVEVSCNREPPPWLSGGTANYGQARVAGSKAMPDYPVGIILQAAIEQD